MPQPRASTWAIDGKLTPIAEAARAATTTAVTGTGAAGTTITATVAADGTVTATVIVIVAIVVTETGTIMAATVIGNVIVTGRIRTANVTAIGATGGPPVPDVARPPPGAHLPVPPVRPRMKATGVRPDGNVSTRKANEGRRKRG